MRPANDALRFALELAGLAALAYWGFEAAAAGEPVLAAVLGAVVAAHLALTFALGQRRRPVRHG